MRRGTFALLTAVIFLVLLVAPSLLRRAQFFALSAPERAEVPVFAPAEAVPIVATPAGERFVAADVEATGGRVLLDVAHDNNFTVEDIAYLDQTLALRGFDLVPFSGGSLQSALRSAAAFVVVTPLTDFSAREITAIKAYVARGGRLLLVGDPSRFGLRFEETEFDFTVVIDTDDIVLNAVANEFDIIFNGDYAFNVNENEGNFRNILFSGAGLGTTPLTADLESVVLYGTHTLTVGRTSEAVLTGDANTSSSVVDRPGGLVMAALGGEGRVLALGDLQFMTAPYFTTLDNGAFIGRIADFLTDPADRTFVVGDFPFFYGADVDLIYSGNPDLGPNVFDEVIALQDAFNGVDINLALAGEPQRGHDALYLGLFNQVDADVVALLAGAGISLTIDPPILTPAELEAEAAADESPDDEETEESAVGTTERRLIQTPQGNIQMSGTALIFLDTNGSRTSVVVLAASADGLDVTFDRLLDLVPRNASYALEDCLLQEQLALCPTGIDAEEVEPALETGGAPEPVDGDTGDDEPDEDDEETGTYNEAIDAFVQGAIALGDTVEGTLAANESHGWTFAEGPALLDITLAVDEDVDGVIEVYDADDQLFSSVDNAFSGENEVLRNLEIPDDGSYTIVVRDFFGDPGAYSLTIAESVGLSGSILLVLDDDGVPQAGGFNSVDVIVDVLGDSYDILFWSISEDGPLVDDLFEGISLVILDSGDYRAEEGFGEDEFVLINFVNSGGSLLINGATPTLYEPAETTLLTDVEISDEGAVVLPSFSGGEIFGLNQAIDVVLTLLDDFSDDDAVFMLHGPASAEPGTVAGAAFEDELSAGRIVVLFAPLALLPADAQEQILFDLMDWVGLSGA